ncbi:MAG: T9SS type A sorting domain-containing protein [Bacteroidetes bacterium]|nr:T9SS type A sorting domain-containing protein [Bacteroidota bacterium]
MKSLLLKLIICFFLISCSIKCFSQNLIVNPGAESGDPTTNGWTSVSMGTTGASCYNNTGWRIIQTANGFPSAHGGSYFFFPGCSSTNGVTFELRQDINVTANASLIDAGWDSFTFSGYIQTYNQTPQDQAQIIVEYRNTTNTTVLTSYNTALQTSASAWKNYTNTTVAPSGTRYIRIRLLAKVNTGPSDDGYFDELSLTSNIPLPVSFTSFSLVPANNAVQINWSTASETNNNFFTVQRSQNQTDWTNIATVEGKVNSITNVGYSVVDNNPPEGILYYRIMQTDINGKTTYSEIRQTRFTPVFNDVAVFPNPAKDIVNIQGDNLKNAQISLYNGLGQTIIPVSVLQDNHATINVSRLTKGIYYIRIQNNGNTTIRKLLIE